MDRGFEPYSDLQVQRDKNVSSPLTRKYSILWGSVISPSSGGSSGPVSTLCVQIKWNESGFRPPLCPYRLNWAEKTSWGWRDKWDDTVLQTQDSKFEPWRSTLPLVHGGSPQYWLSHVDGAYVYRGGIKLHSVHFIYSVMLSSVWWAPQTLEALCGIFSSSWGLKTRPKYGILPHNLNDNYMTDLTGWSHQHSIAIYVLCLTCLTL